MFHLRLSHSWAVPPKGAARKGRETLLNGLIATARGLFDSPSGVERDAVFAPNYLSPCAGGLYVVGDVHGCFALYHQIETVIAAEVAHSNAPATLVLLGDMVDRGPDTAKMLDHLLQAPPSGLSRLCLRGNHEEMMRRFLNDPNEDAAWLEFGGAATLASYGITPELWHSTRRTRRRLLLEAHIPQYHFDFLENLPHSAQYGTVFLSHAGLNPDAAPDAQTAYDLLWSRSTAVRTHVPCGISHVIHGHIPRSIIDCSKPVIGLDTGAYATGALSALAISATGRARLIQTAADRHSPIITDVASFSAL